MGADARRDFTVGTFQNLAARLEKWTPVSDELSSLWANSLLRDELAPRVAPDPTRSRSQLACISQCALTSRRLCA